MDIRQTFDSEMEALRKQRGDKTARHAFSVLSEVLRWLRVSGYGTVILPAIDHRFGNKIKMETVLRIDEDE